MLEVHYSLKSPFGPFYSTGSVQVKDHKQLGAWVRATLMTSDWPMVITAIIDVSSKFEAPFDGR